MKLVELVWQCEECGENYRVKDPSQESRMRPANSVAVCIDFQGNGNPWITLCDSCIGRLEKAWPNLVRKFRETQRLPVEESLWDYPDQTRTHSNGEYWYCVLPGVWFRTRRAPPLDVRSLSDIEFLRHIEKLDAEGRTREVLALEGELLRRARILEADWREKVDRECRRLRRSP